MSYRLSVITSDSRARIPWDNFRNYCATEELDIWSELAKYNAKNIVHTKYVEFETEKDVTAFMLRWSS